MPKQIALRSSSPDAGALTDSRSREMGAQLTEQHERATNGMREVAVFGAMMMKLRALLIGSKSTLDLEKAPNKSNVDLLNQGSIRTGGAGAKDTGVNAWLGRYAPKVAPSSARRFESVALAAQALFELPETLAKKIEFPDLVTKAERDLEKIDRRLPKKQEELFAFVKGFSQKSLLDKFAEQKNRGGWRGKKGKRPTKEQSDREAQFLAGNLLKGLTKALPLYLKQEGHELLSDAELDHLIDTLSSSEAALRSFRETPKTERLAQQRALLATAAKQVR
jgi:hypothetical protein